MENKIKQILEQALQAPIEYKDIILSQLFSTDKNLSSKLYDETHGVDNETQYNNILKQYLAVSK